MTDKPETDKQALLQKIFEESRHRPVIPFIGSGVSISAGYPTIKLVIQYLAKVDFAIRFGVFQDRFPLVKEGKKGQEEQVESYRQHPSKYLKDFGWPNLGQLDADLWSWLERDTRFDIPGVTGEGRYKIWKDSLNQYIKVQNFSKTLFDLIDAIKKIFESRDVVDKEEAIYKLLTKFIRGKKDTIENNLQQLNKIKEKLTSLKPDDKIKKDIYNLLKNLIEDKESANKKNQELIYLIEKRLNNLKSDDEIKETICKLLTKVMESFENEKNQKLISLVEEKLNNKQVVEIKNDISKLLANLIEGKDDTNERNQELIRLIKEKLNSLKLDDEITNDICKLLTNLINNMGPVFEESQEFIRLKDEKLNNLKSDDEIKRTIYKLVLNLKEGDKNSAIEKNKKLTRLLGEKIKKYIFELFVNFGQIDKSVKNEKELKNLCDKLESLEKNTTYYKNYKELNEQLVTLEQVDKKEFTELPDLLSNDISNSLITSSKEEPPLDLRDHLHAIVQWTLLRQELAQREYGATEGVLQEWLDWKQWHYNFEKEKKRQPDLLFGDWEMLLDKLCEGNFDLADTLFNEFEKGLIPALSHRLLAFLQPKIGMPLVLTTNFDSLLEQVFKEEGLNPKVFDVHRDVELPSPSLVRSQLSILKLHGSAYGLRFGERLKQQLDTDTRNSFLQYLPKNALIIVLGFSGSERRMMQMLQAFVQNSDLDICEPKLIWIQGPGNPGPLFNELIKGRPEKVQWCRVRHADTFLQELYFKIANSHQSSSKSYSSLPGQLRMTELKLELPLEKNKNHPESLNRCPVQCFVANYKNFGVIQGDKIKIPSGSWATLAGVAFTHSLDPSYSIIWIDLENHQTVEGIIAEFFNRVRIIDPQAPSCNISGLGNNPKEEIKKVITRIREVFQRGRFVLVLDSLESFGRPQMIHHGIPSYRYGNNDLEREFNIQIDRLYIFLDSLLHLHNNAPYDTYWDSFVVITIDKSRPRHQIASDKSNAALKISEQTFNNLYKKFRPHKKAVSDRHIRVYRQKNLQYTDFNKDLLKNNFFNNIPEHWRCVEWCDLRILTADNAKKQEIMIGKFEKEFESKKDDCTILIVLIERPKTKSKPKTIIKCTIAGFNNEGDFKIIIIKKENPLFIELANKPINKFKIVELAASELQRNRWKSLSKNRSFKRAKNVLFLLQELREKTSQSFVKDNEDDKSNAQGSVAAFYCLLSIFRQPRTIPMLRSIIERWALRNIQDNQPNEQEADQAHEVIVHLLQLIAPKKNKDEDEVEQIKDNQSQDIEEEEIIGKRLKSIPENWMPIVSQRHEGGNVWLYREIHESTYDALTENLHTQEWIGEWKNVIGGCPKGVLREDAIIDSIICISWHLLAARTYYVDIFMPTRDIKAFYEYLYHRVTAIRTITLLMAIIETCEDDDWDSFNKASSEEQYTLSQLKDLFKIGNRSEDDPIIWFVDVIGLFTQIPDKKGALEDPKRQTFIKKLKELRTNALETLLAAFQRNQLIFLAQSTPDAVLTWSRQFLYRELKEMDGVAFKDINLLKTENDTLYKKVSNEKVQKTIDSLKEIFLQLQFKARMSKFDFINILNSEFWDIKSGNEGNDPDWMDRAWLIEKCQSNIVNVLNELIKNKDEDDKSVNLKHESDRLLRIARGLMHQDFRTAHSLAKYIQTDISEKIKGDEFQYIKETLQRDSIALKGKSLISQWPFWKPLLDKELPSEKESPSEYKDLKAVENDSIAYEDTLRMTTKTSEDDALHRSSSFALRARSLYLQGHFSQAHHFLDIASTGLLLERIDHRVNASIIHLVRAELLSTSAHKHYPPTIKKDKIPEQMVGELMVEVNTSLKKIKRAEQELCQAEELLHDLAHENSWKIALEFGWAQIHLEKILFDLELLFLEGHPLNKIEYLKKSGALEQSILAGMRRLRNVLDMVPYSPDDWENEEKKITYDHCIRIEKFTVKNKEELESKIDTFKHQTVSKIEINKLKQFRILIVNLKNSKENKDEWVIAGFNNKEKFEKKNIDNWYDLRIKSAKNIRDKNAIVKKFQTEFESKKDECAVLIVQFQYSEKKNKETSKNNQKWIIAGFNDNEQFKEELIEEEFITGSSNELLIELKNDLYNKDKIVELSISLLGRTIPFGSCIELSQELNKKSFDKCKIVNLVLLALNIDFTQQVDKENYPTLVKIERMSYMLWKQLFVAGAYYTGLLSNQFNGTISLNAETISDVIPCLSGAAITGTGADQYRERWKLWCNSMRFTKLGTKVQFGLLLSPNNDPLTYPVETASLRATVIQAMKKECSDNQINDMWNIRRE